MYAHVCENVFFLSFAYNATRSYCSVLLTWWKRLGQQREVQGKAVACSCSMGNTVCRM